MGKLVKKFFKWLKSWRKKSKKAKPTAKAKRKAHKKYQKLIWPTLKPTTMTPAEIAAAERLAAPFKKVMDNGSGPAASGSGQG